MDSSGNIYVADFSNNAIKKIQTSSATCSVTYNGNGSTGGSGPADNNTYVQSATVTELGNTGSLEKIGYTFIGWHSGKWEWNKLYNRGHLHHGIG
ncbi:hypothetical protein JCM15765_29690 [Paradesulfitobacterium aromaticivorans]